MRLVNTNRLTFDEFHGSKLPKYAILSHTWGPEEVTIQEWADRTSMIHKSGFKNITAACEQAKNDGYFYVWVDTNCIDKSSSAELTEAINSMFAWYNQASICYAYLSDVETFKPLSYADEFRQSRWFKRGWTLQELLAPREVVFFAADWSRIGTKATLVREIASATGISIKYLCPEHMTVTIAQGDWVESLYTICHEASIAERMSWLSRRETTRIEDMAYCMLGIFGIHMPLIYGEGPRAFVRLQEEIIKSSDDHSIFCWSWPVGKYQRSLLSPRPHSFLEASRYQQQKSRTRPSPYTMTNAGLSIRLPLIPCWSSYIAALNVQIPGTGEQVGIAMTADPTDNLFSRGYYPDVPIPLYNGVNEADLESTDMFVPATHAGPARNQPPPLVNHAHCRAGALLSFGSRSEFLKIETFPPNRFSESDSILVICPEGHDDTSDQDWIKTILHIDMEFTGATIVEFTMARGGVELVLFAITTTKTGSYLLPQWHYCNLESSLSEWGGYRLDKTSSLSGIARECLGKIIRDPGEAESLHYSSCRQTSVDIAASSFTTTTASILKHIHIGLEP